MKRWDTLLWLSVVCLIMMCQSCSFLKQERQIHSADFLKNVHKKVLDNGLTVLMFKKKDAPNVVVHLAYRVGASDEAKNEKGFAHLVEHMTYKGTSMLSESDIGALARFFCARLNAGTSLDLTHYHFDVHKDHWQNFIPILADCMVNLRLDDQHVVSEREVVFKEMQLKEDDFDYQLFNKIRSLNFPLDHPYNHSVMGDKDVLCKATSRDLQSFYHKFYKTQNAILAIVGDFNEKDAVELIKRSFNPIFGSSAEVPACKKKEISLRVISRQNVWKTNLIKTPKICFYWLIPGRNKNAFFPSLFEYFLHKDLHELLINKEQIARNLKTFLKLEQNFGIIGVDVELISGQEKRCRDFVSTLIRHYQEKEFSSNILFAFNQGKKRIFFESFSDLKTFSYDWVKSYVATGSEKALFEQADAYDQYTVEDVHNYVQSYITVENMNLLEILPQCKTTHFYDNKSSHNSLGSIERTTTIESLRYVVNLKRTKTPTFCVPKPQAIITISNGMRVVLCQSGQLPVVSVTFVLRDGWYLQNTLDCIVFEILLHMLMDDKFNKSLGGSVGFFDNLGVDCEINQTGFKISMLQSQCETVLREVNNRLQLFNIQKNLLNAAKDQKRNDLLAAKNDPAYVMLRTIKSILYEKTAFAWDVDMALQLVEKLSQEDLARCYDKHCKPNNWVCAIVGNFDVSYMKSVVKKTLSTEKREFLPKTLVPLWSRVAKASTSNGSFDIFMDKENVTFSLFKPSSVSAIDQDLIAIKLLNFTLFGFGGKFFQLRQASGLFYSEFGEFGACEGKLPGFDYVAVAFSPMLVEVGYEKIKEVLKKIAINGITEDELYVARQLYVRDLIDRFSNNASTALAFTHLASLDLGFDYYDKQLKRVREITLEEVNKAAAKYFNPDNMSRIRIGRLHGSKREPEN